MEGGLEQTMATLPPAVSLKVLELVMGQGSALSWALGGEAKGARGIKLWPPPTSKPSHEAQTVLKEEDLRALDADEGPGYVIKDGFLGRDALTALRAEVERMHTSGELKPAAMIGQDQRRWAESTARGLTAHHEGEEGTGGGWWADKPHLRAACGRLRQLRDELCRVWGLREGRMQAQLACYPGGGARYLRHLDVKPGEEGQRRLTLLYYINLGWSEADGGCLRIYTAKEKEGEENPMKEEPFVDVAPLGDRLLVFQSRTLEHEVLPSYAVRFSLTMWLY